MIVRGNNCSLETSSYNSFSIDEYSQFYPKLVIDILQGTCNLVHGTGSVRQLTQPDLTHADIELSVQVLQSNQSFLRQAQNLPPSSGFVFFKKKSISIIATLNLIKKTENHKNKNVNNSLKSGLVIVSAVHQTDYTWLEGSVYRIKTTNEQVISSL